MGLELRGDAWRQKAQERAGQRRRLSQQKVERGKGQRRGSREMVSGRRLRSVGTMMLLREWEGCEPASVFWAELQAGCC